MRLNGVFSTAKLQKIHRSLQVFITKQTTDNRN